MNRSDPSWQLYNWGVDVQEGVDPICRGIIRDWIPPSGLIVDFLYPGHREVYVPFGKITGVSCSHRLVHYQPGYAVETLVQRSSDQPWQWYPSRVLALDGPSYTSCAFVEIDYGDGIVRDVMNVGRLRLPNKVPFWSCSCGDTIQMVTGMRALGKQLHQHTVSLPNDPALLAVIETDGFLRIWERVAGMTGAKFTEAKLRYVSWSECPISRGNMKKYLHRICGIYQSQILLSTPPSEPERLTGVPRELIKQVLSFLDVNDQTVCRRVCRAWYSLPKWRVVHIDLTAAKYSSAGHHRLMVTLHKTVTSSTQTLVFSGQNLAYCSGLYQAASMLEAMGSTVPTIMLSEVIPCANMRSGMLVGATLAKFTSNKLLWRQALKDAHSRVYRYKGSANQLKEQSEASARA